MKQHAINVGIILFAGVVMFFALPYIVRLHDLIMETFR